MDILFLGTGSGMPQGTRASPALVVRTGTEVLLLDLGGGCLHKLAGAKIQFQWLRHVVLTGLDAPRSAELASFVHAKIHLHLKKKSVDLDVHGPAGLGLLLADLRVRYGLADDASYTLAGHDVAEPSSFENGGLRVRLWPVGTRLACRVESDKGSLAFWPCEADIPLMLEIAAGADFLVAETPLPQRHRREGLLTPPQVGTLAKRAAAQRVVLTGFEPIASRFDMQYSCESAFKGQVVQAADGMSFGLG